MRTVRTNLIGKTFYYWTVLSHEFIKDRYMCKCRCKCGTVRYVRASSLIDKNSKRLSKSCGCRVKDTGLPACKYSKPKGVSNYNRLFRKYKAGAIRRGLAWELDDSLFKQLVTSNCIYCGASPDSTINEGRSNGEFIYSGIDRVDSSKGYVIGNVVPCCKTCNRMKLDLTLTNFYEHINKIINNKEVSNVAGTKFKQLTQKLEKKGMKDPEALAAWIGRKKYGKAAFQKKAEAGKARKK